MKRTILKKLTACLCLCAVLSGALTVPAGAASFQDVPSNHWAATAIDRCAAQGWFQGKTADTFGVGQPMTRAASPWHSAVFSAGRAVRPTTGSFRMCRRAPGMSRPSGPAMSTGQSPVRPAISVRRSHHPGGIGSHADPGLGLRAHRRSCGR